MLHDAEEGFLSWDPISPLKPHLGEQFRALLGRLDDAIRQRYRLPAWTPEAYALHKHADRLAAASEAFHVVGWSRSDIRDFLEIQLDPRSTDPVCPPAGMRPWQPWSPGLAAAQFGDTLKTLNSRVSGSI